MVLGMFTEAIQSKIVFHWCFLTCDQWLYIFLCLLVGKCLYEQIHYLKKNRFVPSQLPNYFFLSDCNYINLAELKGIEKQSQVGFITIMEYHRFCTVGSFYKNPIHPVWVVGSDTHLTGTLKALICLKF